MACIAAAQFLEKSLCDLHFETVQSALVNQFILHKFQCRGGGGGDPSPPETATALIHARIRAVVFLLLIMSVSQTGLIARKLSESGLRYESSMDESNRAAAQWNLALVIKRRLPGR